jgi:hypothetical protein
VIRRIAANFVPVAQNLYTIRKAKGPGGDLFRAAQRQKPELYQGILIVSPAGKVLAAQASYKDEKTWTQELLAVLDQGLKAFGDVKPRRVGAGEPLPYRGAGVRKDGSVALAVSGRYTLLGLRREGLSAVMVDSVVLSKDEWEGLAPPQPAAGQEWIVPRPVSRKFNRLLSPNSDQSTMPLPEEVKKARISGTVQAVRNGVAYLTYEGQITGAHSYKFEPKVGKLSHGEVELTGVGAYDIKGRRMLSLTLVADGAFRGLPPYDDPQRYGAVVEWRLERSRR